MPKKPKPHRISTLTTAAFGGWLIIRDPVIHQFGQTCKDTEYMLLFHLFDEVLPLVFYFYCTVFRGGDFDTWIAATFRMALVFITFRRKNYDKATLCQLSDILYHAAENKNLVDNIQQYLNAFTEKKVEVFHSVLRRFVKKHPLTNTILINDRQFVEFSNIITTGRSILSVVECWIPLLYDAPINNVIFFGIWKQDKDISHSQIMG